MLICEKVDAMADAGMELLMRAFLSTSYGKNYKSISSSKVDLPLR
jgi:hypothetical protein